jgi:hypothetical protein
MPYILPFFYDYVFPKFVLPNALNNEYGIINYLHTLYSNKEKENCYTDTGESNIPEHMFENNLGRWPTSIRHGGSHLNAPWYPDLIVKENSLYFGKQNMRFDDSISYKRYIYPIKITPFIEEFIGVNLNIGNKLNGEYFWKHMSMEALQDAQQRNAIIFIDYGQENFVEKEHYVNLHECLRLSGIPKEQVILAFNSFNAKEIYESWFTEKERRLEVKNWPYVMCSASWHYNQTSYPARLDVDTFKDTKNSIRSNHFLFKIRNGRPHRKALLHKLASDNLLEKGDWSCLTKFRIKDWEIAGFNEKYNWNLNTELIEQTVKLPKNLESEEGISHADVSAWTDQHAEAHKNSYFYICTEMFVNKEYKSLTEKVFKPIANFQPFFFIAYPGALALLQSLGFKTFHPFIDESYDNEPDEAKRMNMIVKEINRLCSMSKEQIHEWFWQMEDILIHNHNHILEIYKHEPKGPELIKYLHDRVYS